MSLSRQQLILLGIFALFLSPVILVVLMRSSWWQYLPAGLKNHGELVQPPVHLTFSESVSIEHKWVILYRLGQTCDQDCIEQATTLRQIHKAAGRKNKDLAVVLLSKSVVETPLRIRLEAVYPEFTWVADPNGSALSTLNTLNLDILRKSAQPNSFHTYLLDPMGNVILAYGEDADPNDIHMDLKRLLKWSEQENN